MTTLNLIDQNNYEDPFGCGIACAAMVKGLNGYKIDEAYLGIREELFPDYPDIRCYEGQPDLRTRVRALRDIFSKAGIDSKLTTNRVTPLGSSKGVSIVLVRAQNRLHWVLVFNIGDITYIGDTEQHEYYNIDEYFGDEGYEEEARKQYILFPNIEITAVNYHGKTK